MSESEARRTPNFTPLEKQFLIELIARKYHVTLEDKKTNRTTVQEKNETWKKIEEEFNATAPTACFRNADALRRLYDNKKKELRRKKAEEKKQAFLTGGGKAPVVKTDDTDELIYSIISEKTVTGLTARFDSNTVSDAIHQNSNPLNLYLNLNKDENNVKRQNTIFEEDKPGFSGNFEPIPSTSSFIEINEIDTEENTPKKIRLDRPTSSQGPKKQGLSTSRRKPALTKTLASSHIANKYDNLLDRRAHLVEEQIKQVEREENFKKESRKLKIQELNNEHEIQRLKIQDLKLKIEIKKAFLNANSSNTSMKPSMFF